MAPQVVTPYVKSNKNDLNDADGMAEAVTRPTMRLVPIKAIEQQDIQALHRVRERLVGARTALVNEVHGLLSEYGIVIPKGVKKFRQVVVGKLESEAGKLTPLSQEMLWQLIEACARLETQLAWYQDKIETLAHTHPACQRLMTIPGIGPITATALVAAVSDATAFKNGRQLSAWLGLVPRPHSRGGKAHRLGISKRGDQSLRKLLVHGARAVVARARGNTDRRSQWLHSLAARRGVNRATVAVAHKTARVVWALLTSQQADRPVTGSRPSEQGAALPLAT